MIKDKKKRTNEIIKHLKTAYPNAHCALEHKNAFELLIATILSAQCTDVRVNIVTADLFRKYPQPKDYVTASQEEMEQDVRTTGFFEIKRKTFVLLQKKLLRSLTEKYRKQWMNCFH